MKCPGKFLAVHLKVESATLHPLHGRSFDLWRFPAKVQCKEKCVLVAIHSPLRPSPSSRPRQAYEKPKQDPLRAGTGIFTAENTREKQHKGREPFSQQTVKKSSSLGTGSEAKNCTEKISSIMKKKSKKRFANPLIQLLCDNSPMKKGFYSG
jgi:hypothetical protein